MSNRSSKFEFEFESKIHVPKGCPLKIITIVGKKFVFRIFYIPKKLNPCPTICLFEIFLCQIYIPSQE